MVSTESRMISMTEALGQRKLMHGLILQDSILYVSGVFSMEAVDLPGVLLLCSQYSRSTDKSMAAWRAEESVRR